MEWTAGGAALQGQRGHLGQFSGAPCGQQQPRSLGRKGQRCGRANAGAGSGNEDDLSLEAHGFYPIAFLGLSVRERHHRT